MKTITLKSSFEDILGKNSKQYSEEERKQRWNKWKEIALRKGKKDLIESWSTLECCNGCIHINEKESWCNLQGLPCTVNPILSFKTGMVGMACMGASYQSRTPELEFDNDDLPF